jgi:hypothetical protein
VLPRLLPPHNVWCLGEQRIGAQLRSGSAFLRMGRGGFEPATLGLGSAEESRRSSACLDPSCFDALSDRRIGCSRWIVSPRCSPPVAAVAIPAFRDRR